VGNKISFKNRDRLIQLGIAISTLRRIKGLSQDELAYRANISRSHLSSIEAPGVAHSFSIDVFFSIADALDVDPAKLINASVFPDEITKK
jgi:conserved domain protein